MHHTLLPNEVSKSGVFKSGWGENSKGQVKKHRSQFTHEEVEYLLYLLRDMRGFVISNHLRGKQRDGMIVFDMVTLQNTLNSNSLRSLICEYSQQQYEDGTLDRRVLIRSKKTEYVRIEGKGVLRCNLLFVISLDTTQIVTAYYSHKDHEYIMNEERYDSELAIIGN